MSPFLRRSKQPIKRLKGSLKLPWTQNPANDTMITSIAAFFRKWRFKLFGRTRVLAGICMRDNIARYEAEGFLHALMICRYCEHEQESMIVPECEVCLFECVECHRMEAVVLEILTE